MSEVDDVMRQAFGFEEPRRVKRKAKDLQVGDRYNVSGVEYTVTYVSQPERAYQRDGKLAWVIRAVVESDAFGPERKSFLSTHELDVISEKEVKSTQSKKRRKGASRKSARKLKWKKTDTHEWTADLPGGGFVEISRNRPEKFSTTHGYVQDHDAPWLWALTVSLPGEKSKTHLSEIPQGSSVPEAKAAAARKVA